MNKKRLVLLCTVCLFAVLVNSTACAAADDAALEGIDYAKWNGLADGKIDTRQLIEELRDGDITTISQLPQIMVRYAEEKLIADKAMLLQMLMVIAAAALIVKIGPDTQQSTLSMVMRIVALTVLGIPIAKCWSDTERVMEKLCDVADMLIPVMMTLMTASGAIASGATLGAGLTGAVQIMRVVSQNVIIPLTMTLCCMAIINQLSGTARWRNMLSFLQDAAKWGVGVLTTILCAVLSLQGLITSTYDGVTMQSAKYAVDTMIPVVGGELSDMADILASGALLVKNALGAAALISIVVACAVPVLQLVWIMLVMKAGAALSGLMDAGALRSMFEDFSQTALTMLIMLLFCIAFFIAILSITLAVGTSALR